jgi:hypothetical protein
MACTIITQPEGRLRTTDLPHGPTTATVETLKIILSKTYPLQTSHGDLSLKQILLLTPPKLLLATHRHLNPTRAPKLVEREGIKAVTTVMTKISSMAPARPSETKHCQKASLPTVTTLHSMALQTCKNCLDSAKNIVALPAASSTKHPGVKTSSICGKKAKDCA